MTLLLCGLFLFIATHSVRIFAEPLRTSLVARMGEWPYKGVLAVFSLLGFWLLLTGYAQARLETWVVWTPPAFLRHIMWLLMLFALVLLVAAYVPRNHLKKRLKHPMVLSVKVWALAHLLVNGQMHQMVLFGAFLVWAVLSFRAARKRDALANTLHLEGQRCTRSPICTMAFHPAVFGHRWCRMGCFVVALSCRMVWCVAARRHGFMSFKSLTSFNR
jgi:uncharacterized membrane protein